MIPEQVLTHSDKLRLDQQASARIFLAVFNEEGQEMDDLWKCYDKSSGSPSMLSIEGVAGSCYRNVTPVRLNSAQVSDTDPHPTAGKTGSSSCLRMPNVTFWTKQAAKQRSKRVLPRRRLFCVSLSWVSVAHLVALCPLCCEMTADPIRNAGGRS